MIFYIFHPFKASNTQLGIAVMASFAAPNVQTASQNHTQNSANNDLGSQHANGQPNNSIKKMDEENLLDSSTGLSNTKSRYDIYN